MIEHVGTKLITYERRLAPSVIYITLVSYCTALYRKIKIHGHFLNLLRNHKHQSIIRSSSTQWVSCHLALTIQYLVYNIMNHRS